ncbi:MAG: sugar phosphate nucleotidyltransferase [Nanoarchaeota archaeon]|nr:sugar phosphate nucleotidyltransferase [Nanoarchaeota archaeon]
MKKTKIAISVNPTLLAQIDAKVDGSIIRSRSQAMEYYLQKGLQESSITTAVLLIRGSHHDICLKTINNATLLQKQIQFFANSGIKKVLIVTQHSTLTNKLLLETEKAPIETTIIEKEAKGNAQALHAIKDQLPDTFIVMSGDTYNKFDLTKMIKKHLGADKLASMGLMTRSIAATYGNAILDGDLIIDFQEKPKAISSNIVNAGIYIFKKEIFELFEKSSSLEKDIFPKIARIKQLLGFFTHGEYEHLE